MYVCLYVCMIIHMNISTQNNSSLTPAVHWFLSVNGKIDIGYRVDAVSSFYTLDTSITQHTRPVNCISPQTFI